MKNFFKENSVLPLTNRINRLAGGDNEKRDIISSIYLAENLVFLITWCFFIYYLFYEIIFLKQTELFFYILLRIVIVIEVFRMYLFFMSFFKKSLRVLIIKASINTILCMFVIFNWFFITLLLLVLGVLLVLLSTQIGTNRPYSFIVNITLFRNLISDKSSEKLYKINKLTGVFWVISFLMIIGILYYYKISIYVSIVLIFMLMLRFIIQIKSVMIKGAVVIKFVFYLIIFVLSIIVAKENINKIDNLIEVLKNILTAKESVNNIGGVVEFATAGIGVFFAIDRLFELYKDVVQTVKKKSVEYYLIENTQKDCMDQYINDEVLYSSIDFMSDEEVLIQGVIRANLKLSDSFKKLEKILLSKDIFRKYKLFLISLDFYLKKDKDESLTKIKFIEDNNVEIEFYEDYNVKIKSDIQSILPIKFIVELGSEYYKNKNYEKAKDCLYFSEFYSSLEYIKEYYECVKKLGNRDEN